MAYFYTNQVLQNSDSTILAEFPKLHHWSKSSPHTHDDSEEFPILKVCLVKQTYKDHDYIDIREYYRVNDNTGIYKYVPTKKGVRFPLEQLPLLKNAILKADSFPTLSGIPDQIPSEPPNSTPVQSFSLP